jgi:hypothetical protein
MDVKSVGRFELIRSDQLRRKERGAGRGKKNNSPVQAARAGTGIPRLETFLNMAGSWPLRARSKKVRFER